MKIINEGITAPLGFKAADAMAGIKYQGRTDMAMVYSEKDCTCAGTFTTNVVKANISIFSAFFITIGLDVIFVWLII